MSKFFKLCFVVSLFILVSFLCLETALYMGYVKHDKTTISLEFGSIIIFAAIFTYILTEIRRKDKIELGKVKISQKLNNVIVRQSHNTLFYEGNISEGAKEVTKEVIRSLETDRCSLWIYSQNRTSIICLQLAQKNVDQLESGMELRKTDFWPYFRALDSNPKIVANDALNHPATACFTDAYLIPVGIKSMLDVPIIYRGETIGVLCIESLSKRQWTNEEINFAELISSLFSFAWSIKDGNKLMNEILERERFLDTAALVSKTDVWGNIIYVNDKFADVSGWKRSELMGQNHRIVNSSHHSREFWGEMYRQTVVEKKIWNYTVINKTKQGDLYWVDSYIKADFDENGKLSGWTSIRYDVSSVIRSAQEVEKKNVYLEHAAKILRHDMHSGINTYMPRGLSSLERRLSEKQIQELKIDAPMRMIKEGLQHTQKVYKGVFEFTNLVKPGSVLEKKPYNLAEILLDYLGNTSYSSQVAIDYLPVVDVNQPLFCTAIDNLIRNGLKYNDSETKMVAIFLQNDYTLAVQDNGRGMTQEEFAKLSQPYTRKEGQKESGTGLGLNICVAILKEHGFDVFCEKNEVGTKIMIKIR